MNKNLFLAALSLCIFSNMNAEIDSHHLIFCDSIDSVKFLDKQFYAQCVQALPICCVDVIVCNKATNSYLMIERTVPPMENQYWVPGGRMYKGESFFECAKRKCKEEASLTITPVTILDVYSTIFSDSAWDCPTQTINIAVLAVCEVDESELLTLSKEHGNYRWFAHDELPGHSYLDDVYAKAKSYFDNL